MLKWRIFLLLGNLILSIVIFALIYHFFRVQPEPVTGIKFGATFSIKYARALGLDWKETFQTILKELPIQTVRIPVYWDEIESEAGLFNFKDYDWLLDEANLRDKKVILAIGQKLPRWPECHRPAWVRNLSKTVQKQKLFLMLSEVVRRYQKRPNVMAWQIENEPLFPFGEECRLISWRALKEEVELVRGLDPSRAIILSDTGEYSAWARSGVLADIIGISMYRMATLPWGTLWYSPLKPSFYRDHAVILKPWFPKIMVTELQMEPWMNKFITETPAAFQYELMDEKRLEDSFEFVARAGFDEVLVWGVEWWYWMEQQGLPTIWETVQENMRRYSQNPNI